MGRLCLSHTAAAASGGGEVSVVVAKAKIESGDLVQGTLRGNAKNADEAFVAVNGYSRDVAVVGLARRNRALEGMFMDVSVGVVVDVDVGVGVGVRAHM